MQNIDLFNVEGTTVKKIEVQSCNLFFSISQAISNQLPLAGEEETSPNVHQCVDVWRIHDTKSTRAMVKIGWEDEDALLNALFDV